MSFEIDLSGRCALVTGAGQHIGRAIALALAQTGAKVAVNDIVAERAASVVDEIQQAGGQGVAAVFDVTNPTDVKQSIENLAPDVLVNNVGNTGAGNPPGETIMPFSHFTKSDPAEWNAMFAVNLFGVLNCTHAAVPAMTERNWGRVITIISDAARVPERRMATYAAAKAGAAGFSRALAAEVGRMGITVNCVSLGTIESEHVQKAREESPDAERDRKLLRAYLAPRLGRPEDPASLVVFLASPLADWITGQTYPVNGGYSTAL
ncbi:SDR family oxidoreductase [Myxococcota bacterium]|nr:SDR family oxidoreductase [Myxococcota bacterium]